MIWRFTWEKGFFQLSILRKRCIYIRSLLTYGEHNRKEFRRGLYLIAFFFFFSLIFPASWLVSWWTPAGVPWEVAGTTGYESLSLRGSALLRRVWRAGWWNATAWPPCLPWWKAKVWPAAWLKLDLPGLSFLGKGLGGGPYGLKGNVRSIFVRLQVALKWFLFQDLNRTKKKTQKRCL